jgi:hypothetical protein
VFSIGKIVANLNNSDPYRHFGKHWAGIDTAPGATPITPTFI